MLPLRGEIRAALDHMRNETSGPVFRRPIPLTCKAPLQRMIPRFAPVRWHRASVVDVNTETIGGTGEEVTQVKQRGWESNVLDDVKYGRQHGKSRTESQTLYEVRNNKASSRVHYLLPSIVYIPYLLTLAKNIMRFLLAIKL